MTYRCTFCGTPFSQMEVFVVHARSCKGKPSAVEKRRKAVNVRLRIKVMDGPLRGYAAYRKGKLVYVESGAVWVNGRMSNHFNWRTIKSDGTLGKVCSGYW